MRETMTNFLFQDEFNGPQGAAPNPALWTYDLGTNDNELEVYTGKRANSDLDGQGHLVITAERIATGYTSARLKTEGLFAMDVGTFSTSLKIQHALGTWPAFWLLGADFPQAGWPQCGEIDMMEWY